MIAKLQEEKYRKVAFNLYSCRMSRKLTQQKLSDISGVERAKISRIENYSEDFLFSTILHLAEALQVQPERLLDLSVSVPHNFEQGKVKIPKKTKGGFE